jgi:hypothetical protein
MPAVQKKALAAIMACRSGEIGWAVWQCERCGTQQWTPRSCGNRHCPTCQGHQSHRWLQRQLQRLLPCPYFLVTFTLPQSLRAFVRSHQQVAYEALFQASVSALRALASDGRLIGADKLGMFRVLHTWGRQVNYHPHIHYVVPGGGLSKGGRQWRPCRAEFFLPVKALSMLYREAFCRCMERAGLLDQIDPAVWNEAWVVDSRAVGDGRSRCVTWPPTCSAWPSPTGASCRVKTVRSSCCGRSHAGARVSQLRPADAVPVDGASRGSRPGRDTGHGVSGKKRSRRGRNMEGPVLLNSWKGPP